MTTARDIIDITAQAMYTQDAQDSMSSASWEDIAEDERDEWRRIAEAGIAALRDAGLLPPGHADRIDPSAWPAEAEGIAARAIRTALPDLPPSAPTIIARRIMADLAAAGLLPPDGARTLRDDLEFYLADLRRQLPYLATGGPREMAEQIAYDLQTLLDAQHAPAEEPDRG